MTINLDYLNLEWNILVIDDSKLNRAIIKKTLSELNMQVDEAVDGMDGLNALKKKKYDLVLVDIIMPKLDGFGFLAKFKDIIGSNFTPAILMTGSDDLNSKIKGLRIGADDFLLKPLNEKELTARVLSLLRLKSVYSELYEKNIQIKKELDIAKRIQQFIIPKNFSLVPYPRVSGCYLPIEDIGGDFYDCYSLPDEKYGFLIADVTGHGIPAALVMSMAKMIFSIYSSRYGSTHELFGSVNEQMTGLLLDTQYITAFFVIYDSKSKTLLYSNAGHTRALYYRAAKKQVVALDTKGFFIGLAKDTVYEEKKHPVEPGDKLLLYTDGISELKNYNGEEFGENRLAKFMSEHNTVTGDSFCKALLDEVKSFSPLENRLDDIAFLNIEF
ncbi:MAG TPA: SpoIIE family protein phosphatase [Spirochaetota bacterium]|jgi:serine phosphatase RsbU (regulator of sigma subunit)|nr:SpoIIE family protein phosphatase [Spirochaetota bacterium]